MLTRKLCSTFLNKNYPSKKLDFMAVLIFKLANRVKFKLCIKSNGNEKIILMVMKNKHTKTERLRPKGGSNRGARGDPFIIHIFVLAFQLDFVLLFA